MFRIRSGLTTCFSFPSGSSQGIVFDKSRKWNVFFENYAPASLEAFVKEHATPTHHDEL